MLITLDTTSSIPIYVQLRNQIVTGIGRGKLKAGEHLPTVRQLAADAGVNTMTVNKTYQLLKAEGFIEIDRRQGATVCPSRQEAEVYREKLEKELELLSAEACLKGMGREEFLELCGDIFGQMRPAAEEG
ncbi:MAG TPA: GntR family transcriptional regulator [Candidatus Pullilachnospira stercoravium]|uniref:GntR family transcriptional regulator n=1 Tax=Candidatus Pullilachnospira stercoravium TaxID=2840913 RepID=A0A9D1T6K1_9FIRM|nr:GntR family transcriptional regulator [Candidatus Pullilachnospira stercoravium]